MSLGESVASGPFFKAYLANLLPGQFLQPFIDAAFSDLGLDPNVLLAVAAHRPADRPAGHAGAAGARIPRTGQGGEPHLTLPDAITGNPGDQGCGPPGLPLPGPTGCYPYREPLPAPPPGGPPPGPPAVAPPGAGVHTAPDTEPRCTCRRRAKRRRPPGEVRPVNRKRQKPGLAVGAGRCSLVAGVAVLLRTSRHRQPHERRRLLRQQQRHLRRRRGAHPRCAGRQDRQDRTAARAGQDLVLVDSKYKVPADAKAAILSPTLVTARAIQLTPAYTGGPVMRDNAVIPQERTAVPVEWDDFRQQLEKLTDTLQPTEPGGVSTLGAVINTTADNLRGQGANIRDTIIKLSQAFSALGDHSTDIFSTVKNLSILVSALQDSSDLMRQLNQNLASVTAAGRRPERGRQRGRRPQRARRRRAELRRRQPRSAGHHVGQAGRGHHRR